MSKKNRLNPIVEERRFGKFRIDREQIDYGDISQMMRNVIIINAEYIGFEDYIEYTGFSKYFEPLGGGTEIPLYTWEITKEGRKTTILARQV